MLPAPSAALQELPSGRLPSCDPQHLHPSIGLSEGRKYLSMELGVKFAITDDCQLTAIEQGCTDERHELVGV